MLLTSTDTQAIRRQVLLGLARARTPGYHFPGHFLAAEWTRLAEDDVEQTLPDGPHCRNTDGSLNLLAMAVLLDSALATTPRLVPGIEVGARQATIHLHLQFTGAALRGEYKARARLDGFTVGAQARQSLTSGTVYADGQPVCRASGSFMHLPPPPGVALAPLPWQREPGAAPAALRPKDLDERERATLKACNAALRRADDRHAFIEHFWGALPVAADDGARCRVRLGPQHGNRVGHVQGGVQLGLAAVTACAAAPNHPQLCAIAAWYISPGQGRAMKIRSVRFHEGRSFAAVRTEIRNADGSLVLEAVSHHAA